MNPAEFRKNGLEALNNALVPIGMVRFFQQLKRTYQLFII
jgi:hypothetical protein